VGVTKTAGAITAGASVATTGPLGVAGAIYLGVGAAGNFTAAGSQLIGAISGIVNASNQVATIAATATTGLGLGALAVTKGNLETASAWATAESLGTAGLGGGVSGHLIDEGATRLQKFFLASDIGQSAADATGVETGGHCN
jgi:hypothetical protein